MNSSKIKPMGQSKVGMDISKTGMNRSKAGISKKSIKREQK